MLILVDSDARHVRWKAADWDSKVVWARGNGYYWDVDFESDPISTRLWQVADQDSFFEEPVLVATDPDHWMDANNTYSVTTYKEVILYDWQGKLVWNLDTETLTYTAGPEESYIFGPNQEVGPGQHGGRHVVDWSYGYDNAGIYTLDDSIAGTPNRLVGLPPPPDPEFDYPLQTTVGYPGYILFEDPHQPDPPPADVTYAYVGVEAGLRMSNENGRIHSWYDPNNATNHDGLGDGLPRVAWTQDNLRFKWINNSAHAYDGGPVTVRLWRYEGGYSPTVVTEAEDSEILYFSEELPPDTYSDFYYDAYTSYGYPWPRAFFYVALTAHPFTGPEYRLGIEEWPEDFAAWIEGSYTYTPEVPNLAPLAWKSAAGSELDDTSPWEVGAWENAGLPRHDLDVGNGFWTVQAGVREWLPETQTPHVWDLSYHFEEHDPYPPDDEGKLTLGVARMSMRAVTFENFTPQPGIVTLGTPSYAMEALTLVGQEGEGGEEQVVSLEFAEEVDDALVWTVVQDGDTTLELKIREWDGAVAQRVHLAGVWNGSSIDPVQHENILEQGGGPLQTELVE